ncbi:RNA polymerase sigma factor [Sphingomonas populi]|uniref:RNA polymerase sigma factor n=1 Tax=Sphingomonas populi TaxID=2484750 RepID=A0A4Q6Y3D9_9SPHN|nr:RNA polymerase sigma factor [Sphingomonas populi]RZF63869.1 RNA polymerase sigma factor [Sphingomonas populi]
MTDESKSSEPTRTSQADASHQLTSQSPVQQLLALLETEYGPLLTRLSAQLRSPEAAADALHDVYVKLRADPSIGYLYNPRGYLYRMAINLAKNRSRSDRHTVNIDDAGLSEFPDNASNQEFAALATDEMRRALRALHALPAQRQAIFLARWRDEKSQGEIAVEFGLHKRSIQKELARAEAHLRKILGRPKQRF